MHSWFPENISTFGGELDAVFYLIYYIVGFWFLLTAGAIFYVRRNRDGLRPLGTPRPKEPFLFALTLGLLLAAVVAIYGVGEPLRVYDKL